MYFKILNILTTTLKYAELHNVSESNRNKNLIMLIVQVSNQTLHSIVQQGSSRVTTRLRIRPEILQILRTNSFEIQSNTF